MIPSGYILAREFSRFIESLAPNLIKTPLTNVVRRSQTAFRLFPSHFETLIKSERSLLATTLVVVFMLIIFKGPSDEPGIVGNVVRHYTEETSASVIPTETTSPLTDIRSLMGISSSAVNKNQGGSENNVYASLYPIQEDSIQAIDSVSTDYLDSFKADQVVKYTVQSGDTIGSIAVDFDVSVNTLIWANNLKNPNALSLGQVLQIPPVTGIIHTVKSGDTIASIANKYKADASKILSFNDLTQSQTLQVGDELMVPGGQQPGPVPSVKSLPKGSSGSGIYVSVGNGQCVDFVQAHGFSNLSGNANKWAKYINTKTPTVGGVAIFKGGRFGHVALITAVKPDSIQIVEQNYYGPYIIDHREISIKDKSIVGFVE